MSENRREKNGGLSQVKRRGENKIKKSVRELKSEKRNTSREVCKRNMPKTNSVVVGASTHFPAQLVCVDLVLFFLLPHTLYAYLIECIVGL